METAAPHVTLEATITRNELALRDADPIPSWPPLSGNTFTPSRLVIEVEQVFPSGRFNLMVKAHSDTALERWWSTHAAKNGHHDPAHMPESVRAIVIEQHPYLAHRVTSS